jgi:soluble lytic murein transglycosylase-like protein
MFKSLFVVAVLACSNWSHAYAPPIGPAQRHAAMQEAAPFARKYRIRVPLAHSILQAADRAGVPRQLAFRLVKAESSFDSLAVSPTGALGLTQVLPSTGRYACPGLDLLKVDSNLQCGFKYLMMMHRRYGDWFVATAAYNLGPGTADTSKTLNDLRYSHQIIAGAY